MKIYVVLSHGGRDNSLCSVISTRVDYDEAAKDAERVARGYSDNPSFKNDVWYGPDDLLLVEIVESELEMEELVGGWGIDDVLTIREDLTDEQAKLVLEKVAKEQDAEHGINWDFIQEIANKMFPPDEDEERPIHASRKESEYLGFPENHNHIDDRIDNY